MPAKKTAKTAEQRLAALEGRIARFKKKLSAATDDLKKRLARKKVKRALRRKRSLTGANKPKPKAS